MLYFKWEIQDSKGEGLSSPTHAITHVLQWVEINLESDYVHPKFPIWPVFFYPCLSSFSFPFSLLYLSFLSFPSLTFPHISLYLFSLPRLPSEPLSLYIFFLFSSLHHHLFLFLFLALALFLPLSPYLISISLSFHFPTFLISFSTFPLSPSYSLPISATLFPFLLFLYSPLPSLSIPLHTFPFISYSPSSSVPSFPPSLSLHPALSSHYFSVLPLPSLSRSLAVSGCFLCGKQTGHSSRTNT